VPASITTATVRAEQAVSTDDAIARGLVVAEEAAVPDQPADSVAMFTGAKSGAADCCPERELVRDEPLADGTG